MTVGCSFLTVLGLFPLYLVCFDRGFRISIVEQGTAGTDLFFLLFALGMAYLPYVAIRSIRGALWGKLVWSSDSIELDDARGHHVFQISEIVGTRYVPTRGGGVFKLVLTNPQLKDVKIAASYVLPLDDDFKQWLQSLPDLGALDKEKRRAAGKLHWRED